MSEPKDQADEAKPTKAGAVPLEASRIDTLADEFAKLLSKRRHKAGEVLASKYKIERELGDGGMGQVFVAENLAIGRHVAVKVLKPELLVDEAFRKRFQKEAEAIAAIEHPNVVGFLDLVVGDPTFLVMEFVAGPTLANELRSDQKLPFLRAAELARRLCWGLDAAHRAGVIHRDVKPSNIILAPDAEFGEQPKLIDFGVAKTASKPADIALTRHGQIVGTPHYMSPEQITGIDVDARSDVYALGCVLYHMVSGRPPFIGLEEYQILQQHVERTAPAVSTLVPEVPSALDKILQRALAKDPAARFESMQDMARALAEVTRPGQATLHTESSTRSMSRPRLTAGKARLPPGLMAIVALAAAVAGAGTTYMTFGRGAAASSGILIASDPAGATVEIDGTKQKETTPLAVSGLTSGEHLVKLTLAGHGDVERHVQVKPGQRELIEMSMPQASHRVGVTSAPDGAKIFLDGKLVLGTTPTFMTVTDDDFHEVRAERDGYDPLVYSLKPEDKQAELSLELEPEKEPRGTLAVESSGAAQVWLDGVYTGFDTPTMGFRVKVGAHTVELRDSSGSRSAPARINMKQGETMHLTLSLVAKP